MERFLQRISQNTRAIADQYAKNQVQLDELLAEMSQRSRESGSWKLFFTRLTKYP